MAERAYTRRRVPEGNPAPETAPPRRGTSATRPLGAAGAFEVIDLNSHPDGKLLRLCSRAAVLQDRADLEGVDLNLWPLPPYGVTYMGLLAEIAAAEPYTIESARLKAMTLMGDPDSEINRTAGRSYLVAAIRDLLRVVVPA